MARILLPRLQANVLTHMCALACRSGQHAALFAARMRCALVAPPAVAAFRATSVTATLASVRECACLLHSGDDSLTRQRRLRHIARPPPAPVLSVHPSSIREHNQAGDGEHGGGECAVHRHRLPIVNGLHGMRKPGPRFGPDWLDVGNLHIGEPEPVLQPAVLLPRLPGHHRPSVRPDRVQRRCQRTRARSWTASRLAGRAHFRTDGCTFSGRQTTSLETYCASQIVISINVAAGNFSCTNAVLYHVLETLDASTWSVS